MIWLIILNKLLAVTSLVLFLSNKCVAKPFGFEMMVLHVVQ